MPGGRRRAPSGRERPRHPAACRPRASKQPSREGCHELPQRPSLPSRRWDRRPLLEFPAMATSLPVDLRAAGFRGEILVEQPLGLMTTWRIGGPAELLATPFDAEDVIRAVAWANRRDLPWRVLGNGSNLLVGDHGVRGLVLRIRKALDAITIEGSNVVAGAGASFPGLARAVAER